ncbi:MAG: hypothetical protein ACI4E5_12085 [Suilimivivens sp.]
MKKWWWRASSFILIGGVGFAILSGILQGKSLITQKGIDGYFAEEQNSLDFVFIGNSMTYSAINPAVLWQEYGITSYNFAVSEQIIPISYYYIEEALKTQSPKAIVLNVMSGGNQIELRDSMMHVNLDYLPWSVTRLRAIMDVVPRENWLEFFLPIIKMHGNWKNLKEDSIEYMRDQGINDNKGYIFVDPYLNEKVEYPNYEYPYDMQKNIEEYCYDESVEAEVLSWYQKIIDITQENGVDLILIGVPFGGSPEYQGHYNPIFKYAMERGVTCINYNLQMTGIHHNPADNAETFTKLLGKDLSGLYEIEERDKSNPEFAGWNRAVLTYEQEWNAAKLRAAVTQEEWFGLADNENYTFFFAADAEVLKGQQILNRLSDLGADDLMMYEGKVLGVITQDGAEYYHESDGAKVYAEYENERVRLSADDTSTTEIKFQNSLVKGKNCSIMVYDNVLQRVVDQVIVLNDYVQLSRENLKT